MYKLTIAAVSLAGALAGVVLGLAAVPLLRRVILAERPVTEWEGIE